MSIELQGATPSTGAPYAVDNTDWLKTAAILLVAVDHFGFFFMESDGWWSAFGRLAAPIFFFLLGFAQTRNVPLYWIWLGVILTLLESWNAGWTWVAPNILLSLALIRIARLHVQILVLRHHWAGFALLVCALVAVLPLAAQLVDYGSEGWLWALFGLCQRIYIDGRSGSAVHDAVTSSNVPWPAMTQSWAAKRLLACTIATVVYIWQEQREFAFPQPQLAVFVVGIAALAATLCLYRRGPSHIQPPQWIACTLRFVGRHTLEIYAIQLGGSELLVKLVPDLTT